MSEEVKKKLQEIGIYDVVESEWARIEAKLGQQSGRSKDMFMIGFATCLHGMLGEKLKRVEAEQNEVRYG